ncbi:MAG TPA: S46 family peptidase, partial [Balneolaceae bacterium]|nr:S46 family peptidase [Balneolaceae bacterium]
MRTFRNSFSTYVITALLVLAGCSTPSSLKNTTPSKQPKPFYNRESPDDSGMWLLPQIKGAVHAMLQAKGLNLSADAFYDSTAPSLNQAVVRINIGNSGGGTGSFVSDKGLILTNHHVAYDAIASVSSASQNYLKKGFYADSTADEIPIPNYSLYITIEQKDVTRRINDRLADSLTFREREQQSQKIRKQLIAKRKGKNNDLVVNIDDYRGGNRQFMTVYKVIRDVRLVYAPPASIGKYGGDIDNWEWPRHTGDYSFLRAYVAPDGSSAKYDHTNIPYHPATHLTIDASGIAPGDFTMVLGYPGSTFRHESSYALKFYRDIRNPILIDYYHAIRDGLEYAAKQDSQVAVENASERASVANSLKYYQGIQQGFKRYHIVQRKHDMEQNFAQWIKQDSLRRITYRRVLPQLDQAYDIASQTGDLLYATALPLNNNNLLKIAGLYNSYRQYLSDSTKSDLDQANKDSLLKRQQKILGNINLKAQNIMLSDMIYTLANLPDGKVPFYLMQQFNGAQGDTLKHKIDQFLNQQRKRSIIYDAGRAKKFLSLPIDSARARATDSMVKLYRELLDSYKFSRRNYIQHFAYLRPAQKLYQKGMMAFHNDSAGYPDANFTLRLSGGRVHGYSPKDGIYYTPFTTLKGMIAKNTGQTPFEAPKKLQQ